LKKEKLRITPLIKPLGGEITRIIGMMAELGIGRAEALHYEHGCPAGAGLDGSD